MAIPRIRADECHVVVHVLDDAVAPRSADAHGWIPVEDARVGDDADRVSVHPLGATDCRRAQGSLVTLGDTERVDLGGREEVFIRLAVTHCNELVGDAAIADVLRMPASVVSDLATYIEQISDPIAARVAEEAPLAGGAKSVGGDDIG